MGKKKCAIGGLTSADIVEAIRNGVADGIIRIMKQPGIHPADFLQAIEDGTAKGVLEIADNEDEQNIVHKEDAPPPADKPAIIVKDRAKKKRRS